MNTENKEAKPKRKHKSQFTHSKEQKNKMVEVQDQLEGTKLPIYFEPKAWEMNNDIVVSLLEEVKYVDKKMVIEGDKGQYAGTDKIANAKFEPVLVKSNIRFAQIESTPANCKYAQGDIVATMATALKIVDFDNLYAVVPSYGIIGRIIEPKDDAAIVQKPGKSRKDILRRIMQKFSKWMGVLNVLKRK